MSNIKKGIVVVLTAGSIALGGAALAARGGHDGGRMIERISSRLSLDDNQSAALTTFVDTVKESRHNLLGKDESPRTQILEHLEGDTLDQGAVLASLEARADALRAAAPELVASAAAFYDGLSAEQREQVRELLERGGKRGRR